MDADTIIPFIPKTKTINPDRQYYTLGNEQFIKVDSISTRGENEAKILRILTQNNVDFCPRFISSAIDGEKHHLIMSYCVGQTLENLNLTTSEKLLVKNKLLFLYEKLRDINILHGDINVSNVLFDRQTGRVFLIDFETAKVTSKKSEHDIDFYGPPYGILSIIKEKLNG